MWWTNFQPESQETLIFGLVTSSELCWKNCTVYEIHTTRRKAMLKWNKCMSETFKDTFFVFIDYPSFKGNYKNVLSFKRRNFRISVVSKPNTCAAMNGIWCNPLEGSAKSFLPTLKQIKLGSECLGDQYEFVPSLLEQLLCYTSKRVLQSDVK